MILLEEYPIVLLVAVAMPAQCFLQQLTVLSPPLSLFTPALLSNFTSSYLPPGEPDDGNDRISKFSPIKIGTGSTALNEFTSITGRALSPMFCCFLWLVFILLFMPLGFEECILWED
jgi:hypothetical protein